MNQLLKYIVFIFAFSATAVTYGQKSPATATMLDSTILTKNQKIIILMDTDSFTVLTSNKIFIDNCKAVINEHKLEWDEDLLKLFINDTSQIIYADKVTKTKMNESRLTFRIADLLESGKCVVYNKTNKRLELKVSTEQWRVTWRQGRRFKTIDKQLILETEDGEY